MTLKVFTPLPFSFQYFAGKNVGIGTTKPMARLHVADSSGFTALPGGERYATTSNTPVFQGIESFGYWWTSTPHDTYYGYYRYPRATDATSNGGNFYKKCGRSVRLVRD